MPFTWTHRFSCHTLSSCHTATETQVNQPNLQQQLAQSSNAIKSFCYPALSKGRSFINRSLTSRSLDLFHLALFHHHSQVRHYGPSCHWLLWYKIGPIVHTIQNAVLQIKMLLKEMHLTFSPEGIAGQGISKLRNPKHVTKELGQLWDKQLHQTLMNSPCTLSYLYVIYLSF